MAEAVADPTCRGWVQDWWAEASRHLPQPAEEVAAYADALLERFANPRMRHRLDQIAADGSQKLPVRILPVLRRQRAAGRGFPGSARVLAAWVLHLRGSGAAVTDGQAEAFTRHAGGDLADGVRRVLSALGGDDLAADDVVQAVLAAAADLQGR